MTVQRELQLAKTKTGRIVLHCLGLKKDHHFKFHISGIFREFRF